MKDRPQVEVKTRADLRTWLEANAHRSEGIHLVHWKKHTEHYVSWGEIVQEALCFGWIDGQAKSLGPDRVQHLLCPRRPGSHWSAVNKRHILRLEAEGLMTDAGRAVIERARDDGSWVWLDDIENLVVPPDLEVALNGPARAGWDAYPKSEKKGCLHKLKSSKRAATRARWLGTIVTNAAAGRRTFT